MKVNEDGVKLVTLKELVGIFFKKLWVLIIAAAICVGGVYAVMNFIVTSVYESTATLYILKNSNDNTMMESNKSSDFTMALDVVKDCTYLLKSHVVVDETIDQLHLKTSYEGLYKRITVTNPESTRILEVTVQAGSPKSAKAIVNKLCQVGETKIEEAMGFKQVNLYERGVVPDKPSNSLSLILYAIIAIAAMMIVYGVLLLRYITNDGIRSDEDVERYLKLSVLGNIPNMKERRKGYSYYRSYGKSFRRKSSKRKEGR